MDNRWNPLAETNKEKLENDLIRLEGLIKGEIYFIDEELISKAKEEYKRLLKLLKKEEGNENE